MGSYAGNFNGTDDYILTSLNQNFGVTSFSVGAIISAKKYGNQVSDRMGIFGNQYFQTGPDANFRYVGSSVSGFLETEVIDSSNVVKNLSTPNNYMGGFENSWVQIFVTVDRTSNTETFYFDGAPMSSGSLGTLGSIGPFRAKIGTLGSYYFNGLIDDVRVYDRALSAAEVAALYNATR